MNLYNKKLLQVKDGPWDDDLKKGLWCCIILFSSILHLWLDSLNDPEPLKTKIKYCKVYISKLIKGELAPVADEENEQSLSDITNPKLDIKDFFETKNEEDERSDVEDEVSGNVTGTEELEPNTNKDSELEFPIDDQEDEVRSLIEKAKSVLKEKQEEEEEDQESEYHKPPTEDEIKSMIAKVEAMEEQENESEIAESPKFILPEIPDSTPTAAPVFIDESDESIMEVDEESPDVEEPIIKPHQYKKDEIEDMMDRVGQIEKIQKLAKYAISALNYEDIGTAEDQLTQALEMLRKLK
ncbi:hypothetical protein Kpol_2000p85 [Vanderwaltozyma polyspora DSM 70294]|uniref:Vta1 C-terminal domain-containing protein n=1 Tax=Vanderwaltozyma polyspora (strain ATCC 22028 / DSM 70294 / BCRC 21397 / CBS 2163 / NBRC 10782 / NRRL Y-8283 / UCD 57-17) TaxID=436907 RepID=A7TF92_VANPO|nr:uncharacterized protein Kpol_2000p85 [Vanderwaltozyma polyspora DSM 70294]EDO19117.1 hypothetical protein Kpol_2000p85 [Vanderwaltozyma polyspora DSM 70294]